MPVFKKYILPALVLLLLAGPKTLIISAPKISNTIGGAATDTVTLPFTENWDQGSFANNHWSHSGNWAVNFSEGNPAPSADFVGTPARTNYDDTLESSVLSAIQYSCADVYFDFDLKLANQNQTGAEFLTLEMQVDSVWEKLAEYRNDTALSWSSHQLKIIHARGKNIRIRFRAHGAHSTDIQNWYVDNIHIYAVCRPPLGLSATQSQLAVSLSWRGPDCNNNGPAEQWIHWDLGPSNQSIECDCTCDVAAHWTPQQIAGLEGGSITRIIFYPNSAGLATFRARIWQGAEGTNLLVDQNIPGIIWDQWDTLVLNTPQYIDVTRDLWIGLNYHNIAGWAMGTDLGPAVNGYGNMIYWQSSWVTLLSLCPTCDFNWSVEACVESLKSAVGPMILNQSPHQDTGQFLLTAHKSNQCSHKIYETNANALMNRSVLMGYNVWRTNATGDTSTFHKVNISLVPDTTYTDAIPDDSLGIYKYYVTAVMNDSATNSFLCESPASNRFTVSVPAVGFNSIKPARLLIFPNPSTDIINVSCDLTITSVAILNFTGREVYSKNNVNSKTAHLNVFALPAGIYFVKVTQDKGIEISKINVVH